MVCKTPGVLRGVALRDKGVEGRRQRIALVVLGATFAALLLAAVGSSALPFVADSYGPGQDARAYWSVSLADPYVPGSVGGESAYLYSPAFLQVFAPLQALDWTLFLELWTGLMLIALLALVGPVLFVPFLGLALIELWGGNIHLLLALAIVAGFRWPACWALVLLSKVTPGVGLLWFAVRREWRSLAIALAATAVVAAGSALVAPSLWLEWFALLRGSTGSTTVGASLPVPLVVRLPVAVALVVWGARTNRRWSVPLAAMLALPVLWWGGLTMAIGSVALMRGRTEAWLLGRLSGGSVKAVPRPEPASA